MKLSALSAFFLLIFNVTLKASLDEYISPYWSTPSYSNYGSTGIIQMPNARFNPAGSVGFSWTHFEPYINGAILAYPFEWLEASYQYTDVNNALYSTVQSFSGNQTYKDKGFDFKIRLFKEGKYLPQIGVGFRDAAGTSIFASEFLVASKKIKNLDLTFGLGWGKLNGNQIRNPLTYIDDAFYSREEQLSDTQGGEFSPKRFFRGTAGYFAGIEYLIPNFKGIRFKAEFDGTNYQTEGFPFGRRSAVLAFEPVRQPSSKFNFGLMYPLSKNFHLKASFLKGNTLSFGFSMVGNWGNKNPVIVKKDPLKKIENKEIIQSVNSRSDLFTYRSAMISLRENYLYIQKANIEDDELKISFSQSKFNDHFLAAGRVATVLNDISPPKIRSFKLINTNAGAGMNSISIDRDSFDELSQLDLPKLAAKNISIEPIHLSKEKFDYVPTSNFPVTFWKLRPALRSQIGGPEGFYFGDIRLAVTAETLFRRSFSLSTSASIGVLDNYDRLTLLSDSVLPHVRSDIVKYLKQSRDYNIKRMQFNYFSSPSKNIYFKLSAGILEEMFAGYGSEILYRPFYSNFAVGAELWEVTQRDYDMMFSNRDYKTVTGHINFFYTFPKSQVTVALKGGRFLARDSGLNFDFSRRFKSGLRIGAFFSRTDISKAEFGEGSFDKGFYFHIPLDIFYDNYSKGLSGFGLRPLTRDGAQILNHAFSLYGVTEQGQYQNIYRDWDSLYD